MYKKKDFLFGELYDSTFNRRVNPVPARKDSVAGGSRRKIEDTESLFEFLQQSIGGLHKNHVEMGRTI
jgi:hypothetical protein